ncbi:MAG: hypothetical protein JXQ72_00360, partial [Anaerolineae bacterium]|nr:hypothetical protein [Anaerolineae bacterium]
AVIFVPAGLLAGTLTLLSRRDPLLASWLDQGDTYSPPPWFLFSLYGPVLALAVIGAAWTVRRRTEPSAGSLAPVALWFVVVLGLIYVPVNFQRRFMEGWHIPVTMLAAVGWHRTIAPRLRPGVARRLLLVIGISVTLSPLFVLTDALVRALQTDNRHTYITAEEYDLLDRLDAEAGLDDVILAAFDNGNRFPARVGIRSVLGHWSLTAFADDRQDDVERFFDAATPESERIALLDRLGVDFVYVGEDERELGDFAPESVDYLVPVFVGREARLYRVALRPASE